MKIKRTVYPEDYNKNNPMSGFNSWMVDIRKQINLMTGVTQVRKAKRNLEIMSVFRLKGSDNSVMEGLINDAKNIIARP